MEKFQRRIKFSGDIRPLLEKIAFDYKLGLYKTHRIIPVGYEDYNLVLTTEKDRYFVKIFASYRSRANCERYIAIIRQALRHGVCHPMLYKSPSGFLYSLNLNKIMLRLCVMEYIDGTSLYSLGGNLSQKKAKFLIKQAALINQIKLRPKFVYDSWAISNFLKEYKKKRKFLGVKEQTALDRLKKQFVQVSIRKLPRCLVHGDIIKTNVLKDKNGRLHIIDFSVANYYPRIQELAVLLCSVLFDEKCPEKMEDQRRFALKEYKKHIKLTDAEVLAFPIFCDVAHAMHLLQAAYEEKVKHNTSKENKYWLRLGRIGLGVAK
ncbi:MAG: phosphotransferase [Candidatus Sungbacteria bacterium]|nr:phosphotransferase [Candidatus Sungbacteria bacterium]